VLTPGDHRLAAGVAGDGKELAHEDLPGREFDDGETYSGSAAGDFVAAAPFAFFATSAE
jgi:hypothetical protein